MSKNPNPANDFPGGFSAQKETHGQLEGIPVLNEKKGTLAETCFIWGHNRPPLKRVSVPGVPPFKGTKKPEPIEYRSGMPLLIPKITRHNFLSSIRCRTMSQGRSSDSRLILLPRLPVLKKDSGFVRNSSPVTAAGPSRILTGFPIKLG